MKVQVDKELQRALDQGRTDLNVFAKLRTSGKDPKASAMEVVQRVAEKTKASPKFNYRDLDSVLHVSGDRQFITELLKQPEIASASLVPDSGSAFIEPINPREVPESAIDEPTYPRGHAPDRGRR